MKRICLVLTLLLNSMFFYAQVWDISKPDKEISFGVRVGPNYSFYSSSNRYYGSNNALGFQAGMAVCYNIIKSFSIESGVYYAYTNAIKHNYRDKKYVFPSCEIPLLTSFKLSMDDDTYLHLKSGFSVSKIVEEPETLKIKKLDYAAIVGVGFSSKKIYVGAQYEIGISDVAEEIRKNYIAIMLGYDF